MAVTSRRKEKRGVCMSSPPLYPSVRQPRQYCCLPFCLFLSNNCLREEGSRGGRREGKGGQGDKGRRRRERDRPEIHLSRCPRVVYCLGLRKANCWKGPHSNLALDTVTYDCPTFPKPIGFMGNHLGREWFLHAAWDRKSTDGS